MPGLPRIHANSPMLRFDAGGHRGAGGPAGEGEGEYEAHLLEVEERHIQRLIEAIDRADRQQRMRRRTLHTEWAYAASAAQVDLGPQVSEQFRVTYIYAYIGGNPGGTLYLKGGISQTSLALPIPPSTQPPLLATLGDEETGGIILERNDYRYVKTADASAQTIVVILAGELLRDSRLA